MEGSLDEPNANRAKNKTLANIAILRRQRPSNYEFADA